MNRGRAKTTLDTVVTTLLGVAAVVLLWVHLRPAAGQVARGLLLPEEPVSLAGAQLIGNPNARVGLLVFSDFECPYCGDFARDTWPALEERYVRTGQVLVAFRHLPIEQIHLHARRAAEAAVCAGRQGRFWDMHDRLFSDQGGLGEAGVVAAATALGLDLNPFAACLDSDETAAAVDRDQRLAGSLGITGTPTFMVGTLDRPGELTVKHLVRGAQAMASFERILGSWLD